MGIRQNRRGTTEVINYLGYDIQIRRFVRNDNDASYSVIVTQPHSKGSYLLRKTFSNIKTKGKEIEAIEKAKKWCEENEFIKY